MKILYVITKSEVGGAQTHLGQLVDHFSKRGDELYVMSYPGGWLENRVAGKAKFIYNVYFSNSFNPIRAIRAILKIRTAVREIKPDVVHCHSSAAAAFARLAVFGKIPTIYTAHGWGFNIGTRPIQKYLAMTVEKILEIFTKKIICVSDFVKNLGVQYGIASENKFVLIHNGVRISGLRAEGIGDKIQIITVGRLANPKIPELIIDSILSLDLEIQKQLKLLILGGGPNKKMLEEKILNSQFEVEMLDVPLEKVQSYLLTSDIFILLSRWEGFPYSVLEAMSVALPVIASDVGGISEAVKNDQNGFLVQNNIQSVSEAILKLVKNKELRQNMGQASLEAVRGQFSEEIMCEKTERLYVEVISGEN